MITTQVNARTASPIASPRTLAHTPPPTQPRALVLAGDESTGRLLNAYLARGGFATEIIPAAGPVLAEIGRQRPHVIFLGLGDHNGAALQSCEEARRTVSTPIIACSTSRELAPVVSALQAGADDYFVLPMRTPEFVSRVRAIVRRVRRSRDSAPPQDRIVAGDLEVRPQEHRAYRNGRQLDLIAHRVSPAHRARPQRRPHDEPREAAGAGLGSRLHGRRRQLCASTSAAFAPSSAMIRSSPALAASATASNRRSQSPRRPPEPRLLLAAPAEVRYPLTGSDLRYPVAVTRAGLDRPCGAHASGRGSGSPVALFPPSAPPRSASTSP